MSKKVPLTREVPKGCDSEGKEIMDSTPISLPVKFKSQNDNLAAIVNRLLDNKLAKPGPVDLDELDFEEDPLPETMYEYVHDDDLGREVTRVEKQFLDRQRLEFENFYKQQRSRYVRKNQSNHSVRQEVSPTAEVDQELRGPDKKLSKDQSSPKG